MASCGVWPCLKELWHMVRVTHIITLARRGVTQKSTPHSERQSVHGAADDKALSVIMMNDPYEPRQFRQSDSLSSVLAKNTLNYVWLMTETVIDNCSAHCQHHCGPQASWTRLPVRVGLWNISSPYRMFYLLCRLLRKKRRSENCDSEIELTTGKCPPYLRVYTLKFSLNIDTDQII